MIDWITMTGQSVVTWLSLVTVLIGSCRAAEDIFHIPRVIHMALSSDEPLLKPPGVQKSGSGGGGGGAGLLKVSPRLSDLLASLSGTDTTTSSSSTDDLGSTASEPPLRTGSKSRLKAKKKTRGKSMSISLDFLSSRPHAGDEAGEGTTAEAGEDILVAGRIRKLISGGNAAGMISPRRGEPESVAPGHFTASELSKLIKACRRPKMPTGRTASNVNEVGKAMRAQQVECRKLLEYESLLTALENDDHLSRDFLELLADLLEDRLAWPEDIDYFGIRLDLMRIVYEFIGRLSMANPNDFPSLRNKLVEGGLHKALLGCLRLMKDQELAAAKPHLTGLFLRIPELQFDLLSWYSWAALKVAEKEISEGENIGWLMFALGIQKSPYSF